MLKLAEITGLSFADIAEIAGWAFSIVMSGVFLGNCMTNLLFSFIETVGLLIGRLVVFVSDHFSKRPEKEESGMSGTVCPLCGGNMYEDMYTGDISCDCCHLIIRYDGTYDYSLYNELRDG